MAIFSRGTNDKKTTTYEQETLCVTTNVGCQCRANSDETTIMKHMQLSIPGGLDNLHLVEVETPRVRDNEILIKVAASSLNYHDLLVALGSIPTED